MQAVLARHRLIMAPGCRSPPDSEREKGKSRGTRDSALVPEVDVRRARVSGSAVRPTAVRGARPSPVRSRPDRMRSGGGQEREKISEGNASAPPPLRSQESCISECPTWSFAAR
jgi:hypothetical protein